MALQELHEGQTILVQGSAKAPYEIRLVDGLVSCSCPAWRNAGGRVRLCKHIRANVLPSCIPVLDQSGMEKIDWDSLPPTTTDSGLYRIVCTNGNFYIGSTDSFKTRWKQHRSSLKLGRHHNAHLQADYVLLGIESFSFRPYRDIADTEERLVVETENIRAHFGSDCYNRSELCPPSALGTKRSPETRARMSAANTGISPETMVKLRAASAARKGVKCSPETRAKMSAAHMGLKPSAETRAKLRAAATGRKHSPETVAQMSATRIGRKASQEARTKMSISRTGMKASPEARVNMRAAQKGKKHTPEARAKMSAAQKGRKIPMETRIRMSAAHSGKKLSPEHRDKIVTALRSPETRAKLRAANARRGEERVNLVAKVA